MPTLPRPVERFKKTYSEIWRAFIALGEREAGISDEEIRQVAVLAITTLGFPAATRALMWILDVV